MEERKKNEADYMKTKMKFRELCKDKEKSKEKEIEKIRNVKTDREILGLYKRRQKKTNRRIDQMRRMERTL